MKIAIVKPEWGIRGGFEVVVDRVVRDLVAAGHEVERVEVGVSGLVRAPFGVPVEDHVWARSPEWFTHLALIERFRALDLRHADAVISTQPPSYAIQHPYHLALFYHHARAFYDLEQVWIDAGRAPRALHEVGSAMLRDSERGDLAGVTHFLAGSRRVVERLHRFQGADVACSVYESAAPDVGEVDSQTYGDVLTVSRHEFTKRTELVVQALALGQQPGDLVGSGGRLPFVRDLAARIATGKVDARDLGEVDLWLNLGSLHTDPLTDAHPHIRVLGAVDDARLADLYRTALCVVAPAYDEDDGLTVLEAMAYGRPVVVCRDGGGLTALVEDGVNGFVVEPDGAAIAEAIGRFASDRDLARTMGAAARETVRARTPEHARAQLFDALRVVTEAGAS